MLVILNISSENTDPAQYIKQLRDGDSLVVVFDNVGKPETWDESIKYYLNKKNENIVKLYNEIVKNTDEDADILLLSDQIDLCDDFYENMSKYLYTAEKHAIVYGQEIDDKKSLIETARKYFPKYTVTIQANAACALIKRPVINTLGFLDTSYGCLQYALMDYYCRLNRYGYSSIISHHALFSYNDKKQEHDNSKDKELFGSRYEKWDEKARRYAERGKQAGVDFLELIDSGYEGKKRILFDCAVMPAHYCGTSVYQISVFEAFSRLFKDKHDIYLYTNRQADVYHKLSSRFDNVLFPETISGSFHLGYAPNQLMFHEFQSTLNKHCLKVIQTMFDIMMVRIDEHLGADVNTAVGMGIKLSDGIVFISNYTKNDFLACFPDDASIKSKQLKVIYPAIGKSTPERDDHEIPFEEYFLIVGNSFEHKAIKEAVDAVSKTKFNYIIVGAKNSDYITPNIYGYKGGHLEDEFLNYLYAKCKAVIFPSLYEGFGLPIVISFSNHKRVILKNNELNKELFEHFGDFKDYFLFFDRFEQIGEIVDNTDFSEKLKKVEYEDSWDRVATELETFFSEILETEVNADVLNERMYMFKIIDENFISSEVRIEALRQNILALNHHVEQVTRGAEMKYKETGLFKHLLLVLKEHAKYKLPGFFKFLKRATGRSSGE